MNKFKRLLSLGICGMMMFSVACKDDEVETLNTVTSASEVQIWSCLPTLKILKEKEYDESIKTEPAIDMVVANGEYENSQIIITPEKDVTEYTVTAFDLVHEDGETVFPKDRIDVYKQKYMIIESIFETATGAETGYYPDAILPFDAAVKYKENTIVANENQGITFRFDMTPTANEDYTEYDWVKAGVYTGKIKLDFKVFEKEIPVRLEILDVRVSQENNLLTIMGSNGSYQNGELNYSQDMQDAYTQALIDYRLAPSALMRNRKGDAESVQFFADKAYEFLRNPKCSNLCFFVKNETVIYTDPDTNEEITLTSFDRALFMADMRAIIKKSVEKNLNMVDKMTAQYVDEPVSHNRFNETKAQWFILQECLETIVSEIENTPEEFGLQDNPEGQAEYIESVRSFVDRFVVTEHYNEQYAPYVKCWCPNANGYDTPEQRAQYAEQKQKWFYHSKAPYPCFNTEVDAVNLRSIGWIMAEYDVKGLLYWATNIMGRFMKDNKYAPIDDYYDSNVFRYTNSNGNGYLFYPGGQYGLDVPVSTLRLEALRDGLEEYELLYALEQTYTDIEARTGEDFNTKASISELGSALYNGTKIYNKNDQTFLDTRSALLQLANCTASPAQMCIMDSQEDDYGKNTYKVYLKGDTVLKSNGEEVTNKKQVADGYIYTVEVMRSQEENLLNLSFEIDGQTYTYKQSVGGKIAICDASTFTTSFVKQGVKPTLSLVDGNAFYPSETGIQVLKMSLPNTNTPDQVIRFEGDFIAGLQPENRKLILHFYNPNETDIMITFKGKKKENGIYIDVTTITLTPGQNSVTLDLSALSITETGIVEHLLLYITDNKDGTKNAQVARDLYLKDIVVYYN
ncbi:MAG: DUF4091 domain-containing protein [Clostridia bacterium]|nr:DUF4091 domain-containing protein [Clostridia bacterium]